VPEHFRLFFPSGNVLVFIEFLPAALTEVETGRRFYLAAPFDLHPAHAAPEMACGALNHFLNGFHTAPVFVEKLFLLFLLDLMLHINNFRHVFSS
jgi:hypothetical protein